MGRYRLQPDAWRQATLVLLRYNESIKERELCIAEATSCIPGRSSGPKQSHSDPTANAAVRLVSNYKYERLEREIRAVDHAIKTLSSAELSVIRKRFWEHLEGERSVIGYARIKNTGYSRRQMQRICRKVLYAIARELGEM